MRQPRQLFVVVFASVALMLTGCGGSGVDPGASGSSEGAERARVVQHAMGSAEIVGQPKRVVVLDTGELDSVLALGVTPALREGLVHRDTGQAEQDKLIGGPLWQRLGAVSGGRAHEVPDDLWYLGIGPIAADLVLDDLQGFAAS